MDVADAAFLNGGIGTCVSEERVNCCQLTFPNPLITHGLFPALPCLPVPLRTHLVEGASKVTSGKKIGGSPVESLLLLVLI